MNKLSMTDLNNDHLKAFIVNMKLTDYGYIEDCLN
jgi:hypothetical protein